MTKYPAKVSSPRATIEVLKGSIAMRVSTTAFRFVDLAEGPPEQPKAAKAKALESLGVLWGQLQKDLLHTANFGNGHPYRGMRFEVRFGWTTVVLRRT